MKKKKIEKQTDVRQGAVYLNYGMTLADVFTELVKNGVTDFSKVKYECNEVYTGCQGGCDGYCYCPSRTTYEDIRFDWEI
jgi:hypothetical protein